MKTKEILIIGGSSGLGQELGPALSADEYDVTSLSSKDLDVTDPLAVDDFFLKNGDYHHIIFMSSLNIDGMLHKIQLGDIQDQLKVNTYGFLHVLNSSLPYQRGVGDGNYIYFSSILAKKVVLGTGIYSACKAMGERIVEQVAMENARYGIRCNSIRAGYFNGGLTYRIPEEIRQEIIKAIPLKRIGMIYELYQAVRFLMECEYMTGSHLKIAGGL